MNKIAERLGKLVGAATIVSADTNKKAVVNVYVYGQSNDVSFRAFENGKEQVGKEPSLDHNFYLDVDDVRTEEAILMQIDALIKYTEELN